MTDEAARIARLQLAKVLAVLPRIERKSGALGVGEPSHLEVAGRQAANPEIPFPDLPVPDETHDRVTTEPGGTIQSASSAAMVRLAKFSTPTRIRATAFYWTGDRPVVARLSVSRFPRSVLSRTAMRARGSIGGPGLLHAPELLDHGRAGPATYVIEELVFGAHPRTSDEKEDAGRLVLDRLLASHEHADIRYVTEKTHPATRSRLRQLVATIGLPESGLTETDLVSATTRLVDPDHLLPTGWTHGDVVFSNLIRHPEGGIYLIDWESAGVRPVIADLAKLSAAIPGGQGLDLIRSRGPGSMLEGEGASLTATDQAARYYLQELSWWEPKHKRAQQTGRMPTFVSWLNRRLELLARLLHS